MIYFLKKGVARTGQCYSTLLITLRVGIEKTMGIFPKLTCCYGTKILPIKYLFSTKKNFKGH